uniref:Uncharacterized protein n=1 Tax=Rousettus aegyptiacus TaxID=9407 RepID=A0A7J8DXU3_ROUAE|nr:hypothetical protein HJG63_008424 [Rousettus aegyptiacus]
MRNEPEKAKFFQIKEVSPGLSFCLFSVWLHQTMTYLVRLSVVSCTYKHVYTHGASGRVTRKPPAQFCLETSVKGALKFFSLTLSRIFGVSLLIFQVRHSHF